MSSEIRAKTCECGQRRAKAVARQVKRATQIIRLTYCLGPPPTYHASHCFLSMHQASMASQRLTSLGDRPTTCTYHAIAGRFPSRRSFVSGPRVMTISLPITFEEHDQCNEIQALSTTGYQDTGPKLPAFGSTRGASRSIWGYVIKAGRSRIVMP